MKELTVNNELKLNYEDSFHVMSESERQNVTTTGNGEWIGLSDPGRHLIVTVGWNTVPVILSMLVNSKGLVKNAEKRIREPMKPFGYQLAKYVNRTVAGMPADGFRYTYTVQDIGMTGESILLKCGKTIYFIHLYARTASVDDSIAVFDAMLDSAQIIK